MGQVKFLETRDVSGAVLVPDTRSVIFTDGLLTDLGDGAVAVAVDLSAYARLDGAAFTGAVAVPFLSIGNLNIGDTTANVDMNNGVGGIRFHSTSGVITSRTRTVVGGEHASTQVPLTVQLISSQTAAAFQVKNSSGVNVFNVSADGTLNGTNGVWLQLGESGANVVTNVPFQTYGNLYAGGFVQGASLIALQSGGTAGVDEVQISHDGDNAKIIPKSGDLYVYDAALVGKFSFNSAVRSYVLSNTQGSLALHLNGAITWSATNGVADLGIDTGLARVGSGELRVTDGSSGLGNIVAEAGKFRQDGGVAGTDEVQVYHDGTNGVIEAKSGSVYLTPGAGGYGVVFGDGILRASSGYTFQSTAGAVWATIAAGSGSQFGRMNVGVTTEANTAGVGSPNVLEMTESRSLFTNEGATAQNYHTLPSAAAGLDFEFVVQDADGIRVVANAGDTIRDVGTVSAAAGYIQSTTVGSVIRLKAINATEWVVVSKQGTWTIDS